MSKRLEAAMKAHREAPRKRGMDASGPMRAALAAADAVMFGDDGVERVAIAIAESIGKAVGIFEMHSWGTQDAYRNHARYVIAALRDAPHATGGANGAVVAPVDAGDVPGAEGGVCEACTTLACIDCDGTVKADGWGWDTCPCKCNPAANK